MSELTGNYFLAINYESDTPKVLGMFNTVELAKKAFGPNPIQWHDADACGRYLAEGFTYAVITI